MPDISYIKGMQGAPTIYKVGSIDGKKFQPPSPIAMFDSGVGGLTVLSEVIKQMPHEDVVYLADNKRVPYGSKTDDEIIKINQKIIGFFVDKGAKIVIMACGTSSSIAYPIVAKQFKVPIISLIEPGAKAAALVTKSKKIGVIATEGTVRSGAYQTAIKTILGIGAEVIAVPCPLFVPLVEGGFLESLETKAVAEGYLNQLRQSNIDTLIFGCTHYPHLKKVIQEIMGPAVNLIDPAHEAVLEAKKVMEKNKLLKESPNPAHYTFLTTNSTSRFQELGSKLLKRPILGVTKVDV
ncbi:MAG: glutamate racemase [bacterium]